MMEFTKMQGCGNDYVYIDTLTKTVDDPADLSIKVSNRNFGIGSDGLIIIGASDKADFRMDIYNSDGSRAEMCGNGIRCAAKYVYDKGFTAKTELNFETLAGIRKLKVHAEDGAVESVTVDMGIPDISPDELTIDTGKGVFRMLRVSMGNPHAVIFCSDTESVEIEEVGTLIENNPAFPNRTNTEFVEVEAPGVLKMRVWERGSGETLACGTGACASAVAAAYKGLAGRKATVKLKGGELDILWDAENDHVYMTGPAETVFEGVLF